MTNENNDNASKYDGLAPEVGKILRDREFKNTIKMLQPNPTKFRIIKGFGFMLVLASGLFGYFLKANAEATSRKVQTITAVLNEKKDWMRRVNSAILELRKTRLELLLNCHNGKSLSLSEQTRKRLEIRMQLIKTYSGIGEIFGEEIYNLLKELTQLDYKIVDVCSPTSPDDEAYLIPIRKANTLMKNSIQANRQELAQLNEGIWDSAFLRF